ncbi:neuronal calcium sensor 2-like [Lingula anatina]|uniref:Neuronal calcium sensor 2-like n=1 Tax=Lingula anatina TaxID=7574 RepID=A0A1S3JQF2_LINAN|nr:neuronal calcium sensor 2-like [Lingula anatina]|eukprot:XP_013406571.1 neuronal calcium sensor 2-like [Lingula anatina]
MGNSRSKNRISKEDLLYLAKHTQYDKKQIKQLHKSFWEENPSGTLSRGKLMHIFSCINPTIDTRKAADFYEHIFRAFDADRSGDINFRDYLLTISITSSGDLQNKLSWTFSMCDIDGNGMIGKKEILHIMRAVSKISRKEGDIDYVTPEECTDQIFSKMDLDDTGDLTKEEFINGCLKDEFLCRMLKADVMGP